MTPALEAITPDERHALGQLEAVVRQGWQGFVTVGEALLTIRDQRLYREGHRTFGDYCEQVWGWSRQRAQQLIEAAETSSTLVTTIGVQPQNERQARELKEAAKVIGELEPEKVVAVAQYLQTATGSDRPSTSQVRAAAEVAAAIDAHATVAHPDTGQEVKLHELTGEQRAAAIAENVSTGTHERLQRQAGHVQASVMQAKSNGRGGWADWVLTYAQQSLTDSQELRLIVKRDSSGNATVQALVVDTESHQTVVYGDTATYLKKAVLNLAEEVRV
ncbi:hypothetical protein [Deinococcus yunweiensis]|uniref:hypothetical protein n=1 Tax=Deinococcus yunweiensis TaxID=367282 RepID=UPI00398EB865